MYMNTGGYVDNRDMHIRLYKFLKSSVRKQSVYTKNATRGRKILNSIYKIDCKLIVL